MKKDEKFPGLTSYKLNYLTQRLGAIKEAAGAVDLKNDSDMINEKLVKSLQKELNEVFRFAKSMKISKE